VIWWSGIANYYYGLFVYISESVEQKSNGTTRTVKWVDFSFYCIYETCFLLKFDSENKINQRCLGSRSFELRSLRNPKPAWKIVFVHFRTASSLDIPYLSFYNKPLRVPRNGKAKEIRVSIPRNLEPTVERDVEIDFDDIIGVFSINNKNRRIMLK